MQIARCLDPGMSLLVGTVDAHNRPSCCRAVALAGNDNVTTTTVYLPVATSHEAMQNVATTRRVAISASHPIDHFAIQLKGRAADVRLARDDEAAFVKARFAAFAEILDTIGIPSRVTLNVAWWPVFAVDVQVEQVFEQTPGPRAGARVR